MALVFLPILEKSIKVFNEQLFPAGEGYPALGLLLLTAEGVMYLGDVFLGHGGAFLGSVAKFTGIGLEGCLLLIVVESCI
jgi:hypothetical protein